MCIEGTEGAFLGSDHGRRKSGDGGRQSRRCVEVANAIVCEGCQKVLGASKLLQAFCKGLCQGDATNELTDKEG